MDGGTVLDWARDEIFARIRAARREVTLASPFISAEIAREIATHAAASEARRLQLLTCLSPVATANGVLDPEALLTLLEAGWELRSGRNLHAKATLVDRSWGLVGSGNLTVRGLGGERIPGNAELGVVLSKPQVEETQRVIRRWWKEAKPFDATDVERCPKPRRRGGYGGRALGPDLGRDKSRLPPTSRARGSSTGFWLKMIYGDPRGGRRPGWWTSHGWVSDRHILRPGKKPIWRPTYGLGDLLVLYVVGRACPAVVEVTRTAEYEPERVRDDPDSEPEDWTRWAWVTEMRPLYSVPVEDAPSLSTIGVGSASVKRHGHIRLTRGQFSLAREAILSAKQRR